jgi:hypothetical protein
MIKKSLYMRRNKIANLVKLSKYNSHLIWKYINYNIKREKIKLLIKREKIN